MFNIIAMLIKDKTLKPQKIGPILCVDKTGYYRPTHIIIHFQSLTILMVLSHTTRIFVNTE